MSMTKVLIIEDEPLIAQDLELTLSLAGFDIIGPYNFVPENINEIISRKPDLALMDINLNDKKDGIDLALQFQNKFPIIFVTSYYDQPTLKRVEAVKPYAYILKPYQEEEVLMNVKLALSKQLAKPVEQKEEHLQIKVGAKSVLVTIPTIAVLKADSNYTQVILKNGNEYCISQTLKVIHEKLDQSFFIRVHKSYVINSAFIEGFSNNKILLRGITIPVGRTYKKDLHKHLSLS